MKQFFKVVFDSITFTLFHLLISIFIGLILSWFVELAFTGTSIIVPEDLHKPIAFFIGVICYMYSVLHEEDIELEYVRHQMKEELRTKSLDVINQESTLDNLPKCPSCNNDLLNHGQNYCDECGQALKWNYKSKGGL
jgi:hypothetical protein